MHFDEVEIGRTYRFVHTKPSLREAGETVTITGPKGGMFAGTGYVDGVQAEQLWLVFPNELRPLDYDAETALDEIQAAWAKCQDDTDALREVRRILERTGR